MKSDNIKLYQESGSKFKLLEISNSKKDAIKTGKWKDPGAKLYDQMLDSHYYEDLDNPNVKEIVNNPNNRTPEDFLEEAYLVAPIKQIKNSPYGITPYSKSGCKYPHHVVKGDKLVLSIPGVKRAWDMAFYQHSMTPAVKRHLNRHLKELGLKPFFHHGQLYWNESAFCEKIEQNFEDIENYIFESTGIDLYSPKDLFEEKSHGKLKSSFRFGINPDNGHKIKIVFDLNPNDVKFIGHHFSDNDTTVDKNPNRIKNINKTGNNDFVSNATVKAIVDIDTNKNLQTVKFIGSLSNYLMDITPFVSENTPIYKIAKEDRAKTAFEYNTLRLRELVVKQSNWNPPDSIIQTFKVGQKETGDTYKATRGVTNLNNLLVNMNSEHRRKNFNARGINIGSEKVRKEIYKLFNEVKILVAAIEKIPMVSENKKLLQKLKDEFKEYANKVLVHCKSNEVNKALDCQNECISIRNHLRKFLNYLKESTEYSSNVYQEITERMEEIEDVLYENFTNNTNKISIEMNKLPKEYQKFIKDCNKKIIKKMLSLIKTDDKFHRLNEKYIIDELVKSMSISKWIGYTNICKKSKSYEGYIFITNAKQDYEFYYKDKNKQIFDDETFREIYNIYYSMMKAVEKELKDEFKEYKEKGFSFILRGDPIDNIHMFEFDLSSERSEELWNYTTDENVKMYGIGIVESSDILDTEIYQENYDTTYKDIYQLNKQAVVSPYFVKWLFKTDEFKDDDPENFDFNILINDPKKGNFVYGYYVNQLDGIIRIRYRKDEDYYAISMLFVNKEAEGKGIGQTLFRYAIDNYGNKELRLNVFADNDRAIHIYKKYGFVIDEKIKVEEEPGENNSRFVGREMYKMKRSPINTPLKREDILKSNNMNKCYDPPLIYDNILNESYIISEDNLEIDLDKWKIGVDNILFITGQSGSGKSTLAEKLAKENNALWISIDFIGCRTPSEIEEWIKNTNKEDIEIECLPYIIKFYENFPEFKNRYDDIWKDDNKINLVYLTFIRWIIKEIKTLNRLVIIEGYQLAFDISYEEYENYPLIIIGSSMIKSAIRRIKRGYKYGFKWGCKSAVKNLLLFIKKYKMWFSDEKKLDELRDHIKNKKGWLTMENSDMEDSVMFEQYFQEEGENNPPELEEKPPEPEKPVEKESMPKKTDKAESAANGVRRKKLYIAFIEWAKACNPKNTFGSVFDKDAFHTLYPFVPHEMRYFYRLANPMLCVLSGNLTFFAVAELRKLNAKNSRLSEMMIFAATDTDVRVFNTKDKKIYRGQEENGMLKLAETLGDTFDTYLQKMINQGDILNAPIQENYDIEVTSEESLMW